MYNLILGFEALIKTAISRFEREVGENYIFIFPSDRCRF